jgi:hypothetical protein
MFHYQNIDLYLGSKTLLVSPKYWLFRNSMLCSWAKGSFRKITAYSVFSISFIHSFFLFLESENGMKCVAKNESGKVRSDDSSASSSKCTILFSVCSLFCCGHYGSCWITFCEWRCRFHSILVLHLCPLVTNTHVGRKITTNCPSVNEEASLLCRVSHFQRTVESGRGGGKGKRKLWALRVKKWLSVQSSRFRSS